MKDKIVIQRKYSEIYIDWLGHPIHCYEATIVDGNQGPELIGNPDDEVNKFKTIVPNSEIGHHIMYALKTGELDLGDPILIRLAEERPAKWKYQFSLLTPMYNGMIVSFIDRSHITKCTDKTKLSF